MESLNNEYDALQTIKIETLIIDNPDLDVTNTHHSETALSPASDHVQFSSDNIAGISQDFFSAKTSSNLKNQHESPNTSEFDAPVKSNLTFEELNLDKTTENNPGNPDQVQVAQDSSEESDYNSSESKRCKGRKRASNVNKCPICFKLFNHPSNLVTHFRVHSGERPFMCPHCNKSFTQASTLDRHILIHTGEKAYKCMYCPKSFNRKFSLTSHINTHTGVRSYMCEYCSKCFRDRSALNKHFLIHTGVKHFMCHLCSKCFSYKAALNTHMRTHSGEKPFQCTECSKCFSDRNNLKAHYIVHSSEKKYRCTLCTKSFKHSSGLKKHIVWHSKLKMKEYQIVKDYGGIQEHTDAAQ